jgi:hypothetical protein
VVSTLSGSEESSRYSQPAHTNAGAVVSTLSGSEESSRYSAARTRLSRASSSSRLALVSISTLRILRTLMNPVETVTVPY